MKQGRASSSKMGSTKVEPRSHAVNVESASDIGLQERFIGRAQSRPLYAGRGLSAPMAKSTSHLSGSQGKHK